MYKKVANSDWYWENGLHDAIIKEVVFHNLSYDYTLKKPIRNELIFCIDSSQSMFEQRIRQIIFYNCKIEDDIDLNSLCGAWWINDVLTYDKKWKLVINFGSKKKKEYNITLFFDSINIVSN